MKRIKDLLNRYSPSALIAALAAVLLAGSSGFLTATALGVGSAEPAKTVTIDVTTGPAGPEGPAGPPGPPGPAGAVECPNGFSNGYLVVNHPGGQITLFTCLND